MKLIVLSSQTKIKKEHALLNSLFESGLEYFHLRKPDLNAEEMELYLQQISSEHLSKIILHSHFELAQKYQLKGIHIKEMALLSENKIPENIQKSASFHHLEEISDLKNNDLTYVFLSPIFDSISKKEYKAAFDRKQLIDTLRNKSSDTEVIALGGINEDNIFEALEMGFDGVAILGDIWLDEQPLKKFTHLLEISKAIMELDNLFNE